ncbi:MAG TPA: T9SS type A sorting domain-containing protein, partial [Chitinophagaceae bacterium]
GYIVAGYTLSNDGDVSGNHGLNDYWIIKIDQVGNLQWQKVFGGSNHDLANRIRQTPDGGYIVYGYTRSSNGDVTGFHGGYDYWVIKLNSTGNLQWQKALGGSNIDNPTSISLTNDGGYIMTGASNSTDGDVTGNHGNDDAWVVKMDINGNIQWKKCFGGPGVDPGMDIQQLSDGKYIMLCHSTSSSGDASSNHGQWDYWFLQMDINGVILWEKSYGGSLNDIALAAQKTTDNGYVLFGYSKSNDGDVSNNHGVEDYWVVKLNPSIITSTIDLTYLNQLSLFPNPTDGKIEVLNTNNHRLYYSIYNIAGEMIKEESGLIHYVDISSYSSGVYLMQIRSNKTIRIIKIIKE